MFRPIQSPLAAYHLRQAPTSIGAAPSLEHLYGRLGWLHFASTFADSRAVVLALRHPLVDVGHTTLLSFALRRCRPTASSVCTLPLSLWVGKYPLAATILRQAPTVAPAPKNEPFA